MMCTWSVNAVCERFLSVANIVLVSFIRRIDWVDGKREYLLNRISSYWRPSSSPQSVSHIQEPTMA